MPTKRGRRQRARRDVSLEELEWVTGIEQPGAGKLWRYRMWLPENLERYRTLLHTHRHLIPRGRMAELRRDIERNSPREPRGLASFR